MATTDPGPDGRPQLVIPGAEREADATGAARLAALPIRPKVAQRHDMPERGLWGDHGQMTLL